MDTFSLDQIKVSKASFKYSLPERSPFDICVVVIVMQLQYAFLKEQS